MTGGGGGASLVGDLNCRLFAKASATILFDGLGGTGGGGFPPILCPLFGRFIILGHNSTQKNKYETHSESLKMIHTIIYRPIILDRA